MNFANLALIFLDAALVAYAGALLAYLAEIVVLGARRPAAVAVPAELVTSGAGGPAEVLPPAASPGVPVADEATSRWSARAERWGRMGFGMLTAAFILNLASVVARGIAVERVPWGNMYEFTTMGAVAAVGVFLVLSRGRDLHYLGIWVGAVALLAVGLAVTVFYAEPGPLLPALRSTWLVIHVFAAITATGLFTVGASASALYLLVNRSVARQEAGKAPGRFDAYLSRLPDRTTLERVAFRINAIGFPVWSFAVIAGSIWAQYAWARYWGWDPKETWAFITWVVYACYLHARLTAGWRGRGASWLSLLGYATLIFNFIGVNMLFSGLHSYAGI